MDKQINIQLNSILNIIHQNTNRNVYIFIFTESIINHHRIKAILQSESNFSLTHNFFRDGLNNQSEEVKHQKDNNKKDHEKRSKLKMGK